MGLSSCSPIRQKIILSALYFLWLLCAPLAHSEIDNAVTRSVWDARYGATSLNLADDSDGDGQSNGEELIAGTDPFDRHSVLSLGAVEIDGDNAIFTFQTEVGKRYQVERLEGTDPLTWQVVGALRQGDGGLMNHTVDYAQHPDALYRLHVEDIDSDEDSLSDHVESLLTGFQSDNTNSFGEGIADSDAAASVLQELSDGSLIVSVTDGLAFEKSMKSAKILLTRTNPTAFPATVFVHAGEVLEGESAQSEDYTLTNTFGELLSEGAIDIPAGETSTEVNVVPAQDDTNEVPEKLSLRFGTMASSYVVTISDAENLPENERLFFAWLTPMEQAADSRGSGYSTIKLRGDNTGGEVGLAFSNLTSEQLDSQLLLDSPLSGQILKRLSSGQINRFVWDLVEPDSFEVSQELLDSLFAGDIYLNINSEGHTQGELVGRYIRTEGSVSPPEFGPDPPVAEVSGDNLKREIARFLTQATFGPTTESLAELEALVAAHEGDRIAAFEQWIDDQIAMPVTSLTEYVKAADAQEWELYRKPGSPHRIFNFSPLEPNRRRGWWLLATSAPDQLRRRMGFALEQIFVVSADNDVVRERARGHLNYIEMLNGHAFGRFSDLLTDVSKHPIMGHYLSHIRNQMELRENGVVVVSPDENYAREIMQLFSIGLVELHQDGSLKLGGNGLPIATYTQSDVSELSRVFTGWSFARKASPAWPPPGDLAYNVTLPNSVENTVFLHGDGNRDFRYQVQWELPMKMFEDNGLSVDHPDYRRYHDPGAKEYLGQTAPAGLSGEQDLDFAIEILASHPNTAPFIARRLIQRFVSSNPSRFYINSVANTFVESGGDFKDVLKAILLHPEARDLELAQQPGFGKRKEPVIAFAATMRALKAGSRLPLDDLLEFGYPITELNKFPSGTTRYRIQESTETLGQSPQRAPSVFNFFLPDYTVGGVVAEAGLVVPEFQVLTENSVIRYLNAVYDLISDIDGFEASSIPGQNLPPFDYGARGDNITCEFRYRNTLVDLYEDESVSAPYPIEPELWQLYFGVMDSNSDGQIDQQDSTFGDEMKIREACEVVLDHLDLLFCAGQLKALYPEETVLEESPREIILSTVASLQSELDIADRKKQASVVQLRLNSMTYLVSSMARSLIQR